MGKEEAIVESLSAEVRVLMVGNRQVTLSVYRQLDSVPPEEIEPFGRVRDGSKALPSGAVQLVGRDENGHLVSAINSAPDWCIDEGEWDVYNHFMSHECHGDAPTFMGSPGRKHVFKNFGSHPISWTWRPHKCVILDPSECRECTESRKTGSDLAKQQWSDHIAGKHCDMQSLGSLVFNAIASEYAARDGMQRLYDKHVELPLIILAGLRG